MINCITCIITSIICSSDIINTELSRQRIEVDLFKNCWLNDTPHDLLYQISNLQINSQKKKKFTKQADKILHGQQCKRSYFDC